MAEEKKETAAQKRDRLDDQACEEIAEAIRALGRAIDKAKGRGLDVDIHSDFRRIELNMLNLRVHRPMKKIYKLVCYMKVAI